MPDLENVFDATFLHAEGYPDGSVYITGIRGHSESASMGKRAARQFRDWLNEFLEPGVGDKVEAVEPWNYDTGIGIYEGAIGRITQIDDEGYHIRFTLFGYQIVDTTMPRSWFKVVED